jgi:glycosyltransferase involved in cell wall biosynthesis
MCSVVVTVQSAGSEADTCTSRVRLGRVCLMIGQLGLGGTEKQLVLLAKGLQRHGVHTTVLVMFHGGPGETALREAGIPVLHLGFRTRAAEWRMPVINAAAFAALVGRLRRIRPDVLHAFLPHSYVPAAPAARLAGVPVLVAGRRSMGEFAKGHRVFQVSEYLATRATDLLIANAGAVAENTLSRERVPADKVAVVYNGLPDSAFDPAEPASIRTERPVVLCVANLRHDKGHRYLLDGIESLQEQGLPCTLLIAGEGPERASLERQTGRLGIDVRLLGARLDVPSLLARADVFVLPSLHEGMSNAVMEAMAAGKPIVATAVGGTTELIEDRGVLVPPGDPQALAGGVRRLLTDPELAGRLGEEAHEWSRTNLHVDAMVDRHVQIYRELLETKCVE